MNPGFLNKWDHAGSLDRARRCFRAEARLSCVALCVTVLALAAFTADTALLLWRSGAAGSWLAVAEIGLARGLMAFFIASALIYQVMRLGYLARFASHREPRAGSARDDHRSGGRLTILVPSYMEEPRVVRRTLLAAALQQSPDRRVVLLIDDPPEPRDPRASSSLAAARALPREVTALLAPPRLRLEQELARFQERRRAGACEAEAERLAALWRLAAGFLESLADGTSARDDLDHNHRLFVARILRAPAAAHREHARELESAQPVAPSDFEREYRRLATLFDVEITSFERKRFANLSHEPNKAMNLNAYLSLMGRGFREESSPEGLLLVPAEPGEASLEVPAADFVLVLDADSVILPDYSPRLLTFLRRPGNERVAVVQTPYASVPGARSPIERIAGATTDVQLMSHQGSCVFGAGSWVGASALVRRAALDDVVLSTCERGHRVATYVRDRTLNEDTDTTVALIRKGWRVVNYTDRLAYSATPPDFGALLIQRRRWATGGLIILPDVARYLLARPSLARLGEALIRAQYILAAPVGSLAMALLIFYPFDLEVVWTAWTLPGVVAYLATYGRDLRHNGGRATDVFRTIALNAMLLPINLTGAVNSIGQLATGRKIPFQRTPKVEGRTAATPGHVAAQLAFLLFAAAQVPIHVFHREWLAVAFFAVNGACFAYALHAFIGWRAAFEDLTAGRGRRARVWYGRLRERLAAARARTFPALTARGDARIVGRSRGSVAVAMLALGLFTLLTCKLPPGEAGAAPGARSVAVTFDDLPVISVIELDAVARRDITERLLASLEREAVPTIGFVNEYGLHGFAREPGPAPDPNGVALLRMWIEAGYELGNHGFAHRDLHSSTVEAFCRDVVLDEAVTGPLLAEKGMQLRYFRHPYLHTGLDLETKKGVERFLEERGYRVAPVTVDNEDWLFAAAFSRATARREADLARRVAEAYVAYTEHAFEFSEGLAASLFGRAVPLVLLLHANALNADQFDELAEMMRARGYAFVSLDQAVEDRAYESADDYTGGESLNWLARWAITRGLKTEENVLDDFPDVPEFVTAAAEL